MKKLLVVIVGVIAVLALLLYIFYPSLESRYQSDMDPIRRNHAHEIVEIIQEFADKAGHLPFQEQAKDQPFMVLIGHSPEHEDHFANDPVLQKGGQWANSFLLESILEKELGREVKLPSDPQKVPTYAPNVYIYFISGNQMTVMSHLNYPDDRAVKYDWNGNSFYSYTITYSFNP